MTDDPGTAEAGHWEFNFGFLGLEQRPGSRLSEGPVLDVNYGAGECVHFNDELPYRNLSEAGSPRRSGLGDSALGVKWRGLDGGERGLSVAGWSTVAQNTSCRCSSRARPGR